MVGMEGALMSPTNRPLAHALEQPLSPEEEKHVRAGINASEADDAAALTAEEAEVYYETGVLPDRVMTWAASHG
jgi:hypothetical protein